jgi:indole-3-glycerol phosphate synthase
MNGAAGGTTGGAAGGATGGASILDRLVEATRKRVARNKEVLPPDQMMALCREAPRKPAPLRDASRESSPVPRPDARRDGVRAPSQSSSRNPPGPDRYPFETALSKPGLSFICEVKKASPSKGLIAEDFPCAEIARDYEAGGAACVSVLTEPDFFLGDDAYLREIARAVSVPVLRKDFILDPYQIYQARLLGADAILLICAILDQGELENFLELAAELELSCLTEVHDADELKRALSAGARIIGVNNRDLKTFQVDLYNSVRLRQIAPPDVLFTAESGVARREDVELLEKNGVDAVLVGEILMRSPDRQKALRELMGHKDEIR